MRCKGIYFVPGFISAFSYFRPLAHSGLCVSQTSWSYLPKICKPYSLYTNYVVYDLKCGAILLRRSFLVQTQFNDEFVEKLCIQAFQQIIRPEVKYSAPFEVVPFKEEPFSHH